MIAAALSGTFLGIFLSYGVINPLAVNLHFYNDGESTYLKVIKASVVAFALGSVSYTHLTLPTKRIV